MLLAQERHEAEKRHEAETAAESQKTGKKISSQLSKQHPLALKQPSLDELQADFSEAELGEMPRTEALGRQRQAVCRLLFILKAGLLAQEQVASSAGLLVVGAGSFLLKAGLLVVERAQVRGRRGGSWRRSR